MKYPPLEVPRVEIRRSVETVRCEDIDMTKPTNQLASLPMLREILQGREQESFIILIIDRSGRVSGWQEISRGGAGSVEVPIRETFRAAVLLDARYLVIAHNHPSGNPTPSQEDKIMTEKLALAGNIINVPILDHIIIGAGDRYFSFAAGGLVPERVPAEAAPVDLTGSRQPPEID